MLLVMLDLRIVHLTSNQTLSVKDSGFWVGVEGILGIADTTKVNVLSEANPWVKLTKNSQSFLVGEGYP